MEGSAPTAARHALQHRAFEETTGLITRLVSMTLLNLLCRFFPGRCASEVREPPRAERTVTPTTSADLGQMEAKIEALSKEQLRQMEGGRAAKSAQQKKAKRRPR